MSNRKSAAERRREKELEAQRAAWRQAMYQQGYSVVSPVEYAALCDVENLLALACRRFVSAFQERPLQMRAQQLYAEARAVREKTVPTTAFDPDAAPEAENEDGKLIYLNLREG